MRQTWVASAAAFFAPSHLPIIAAFVMIILAETGKIPSTIRTPRAPGDGSGRTIRAGTDR